MISMRSIVSMNAYGMDAVYFGRRLCRRWIRHSSLSRWKETSNQQHPKLGDGLEYLLPLRVFLPGQ